MTLTPARPYAVTEIIIGDPKADRELVVSPCDINNHGAVVGFLTHRRNQSGEKDTPFYWHANRLTRLPTNGGNPSARANYLNDTGQIAGTMEIKNAHLPNQDVVWHAVLWNAPSAACRDIGAALAPLHNTVFGINARGNVGIQAAGDVPDSKTPGLLKHVNRPYLWDNGTLRPLQLPRNGEANGLNDRSESVGWLANLPSNPYAHVVPLLFSVNYAPKTLAPLTHTWLEDFFPQCINNRGDVAGTGDACFLYRHKRKINLWPPLFTAATKTGKGWGEVSCPT